MSDKKASVDVAWMKRKLPTSLRAQGLRSFMRVATMAPDQIDRAFETRWRRGCEAQVALLFAMFWRRSGDHERSRRAIALMYAQLRDGSPPYKLNSVRGLKEKHVRALLDRWRGEELAPETIRKRVQELGDFAAWFEKRQVVDNVLRARAKARKRETPPRKGPGSRSESGLSVGQS